MSSVEFKFIETNEDGTHSYDAQLDNICTVSEFIELVLKQRPKDYGRITLLVDSETITDQTPYCMYESGKMKSSTITYKYLDKYVLNVVAKGVLHRMDYIVYVRTE